MKKAAKGINTKGMSTMLAVLIFILLAFILVLFFYFGYNLIKELLMRGFQ